MPGDVTAAEVARHRSAAGRRGASQQLAWALLAHNEALMAEERFGEAFAGARELEALLRTAPVPDKPLTARMLTQVARLHLVCLESAAAIEPATAAVELCRQLVEQDPSVHRPMLIAALEELYVALQVEGRTADAKEVVRALVAELRLQSPADLSDHDRRLGEALSELAAFELEQGDRPAAVDALRESVRRYATLADADPAYAASRDRVSDELSRAVELLTPQR